MVRRRHQNNNKTTFRSFKWRVWIKLENELITNKLKDTDENVDIDQHEIEKFLLILHLPMQSINSEENTDDTDGIPETILKIALKLTELLKINIDLLKIPEILKLALNKLRSLFLIKKDGKNEAESESRQQPEETSSSTSDS